MKQRLGGKKHRRCEVVGGRAYRACYTSGHYGHGVAECWFGEGEKVNDADYVNYVEGTVAPKIRGGQFVEYAMNTTGMSGKALEERG